jgi:hypothetical protein
LAVERVEQLGVQRSLLSRLRRERLEVEVEQELGLIREKEWSRKEYIRMVMKEREDS